MATVAGRNITLSILQYMYISVCAVVGLVSQNKPTRVQKFSAIQVYSVSQKVGLNFVRLYFLNYTWYVNDLHESRCIMIYMNHAV